MKNTSVNSRVVLEVDLGTLERNFRKIAEGVAPLGVVAVLKADAYGLGMGPIARRLGAAGAAGIATAELAEALAAQAATGGRVPVGILGSLLPDEIAPAVRAGIRIPLSDMAEARAVSAAATRLKRTAVCHVALDTGMSRIGVRLDEAEALVPRFAALPGVRLEGLYSHFPTANVPGDPATAAQVRAVKALARRLAARGIRFAALHVANSDGINNVPASCRAPFTHVRAGINLHGSFDPVGNRRLRLEPVFSLKARLAQVRRVKAGSTIGYGRTWTAPRDMLVGTVAAGYADGLPLALSNRGSILVGGELCPVVGRICMDFTTVDLAQVPDARAGDECVCLGRQGAREIGIDEWATLKGTHPYEVLCAIGSRVRRVHVG
ncbi:MAG: alanine racemase [Kiritimatiellae bacterium]|nr:alanine racemase [Kiritimatiellia bacterium]